MAESNTVVQLKKLLAVVPDIIKEVEYSELYGYDLLTLADTPKGTVIRDRLLSKFLVANKFVIDAAASQLKKTLAWRRDFNPLSAAFLETHNPELEKLGIITSVPIPRVPKKPTVTATPAPAPAPAAVPATEESKEVDVKDEPEVKEADVKDEVEAKEDDVKAATEAKEAETEAAIKTDVEAEVKADAEEEVKSETKKAVVPEEEVQESAEEPEEVVEAGNIITTWNLYGAVKNRQELFSDLNGFIRWRVGLMERSVALLDFTSLETSYGSQLHDYNNVSFLFMDSATKAISKNTIELFQSYYPEMMNVKYFVNVPTVMSWMFAFAKLLVSKETMDKFCVLSNGTELAKVAGSWVPKQYGGNADSIEEIKATNVKPVNPELVTPYESKKEAKKEAKKEVKKEEVAPAAVAASETETETEPEPKTTEAVTEATTTESEVPTSTVASKVAEPKTAEPSETTAAPAATVTDTVVADEPTTVGAVVTTAEPEAVAEEPKVTATATESTTEPATATATATATPTATTTA